MKIPYDIANMYESSPTEQKWQKKWEEAKVYEADLKTAKDPYYSMVMFPYPSGDKLHVGHWYNFAPADSFARFMRMRGKDVFTPIGFDAFGLPAENYAIKTGVHPDDSITQNVETMITQLKRIGCMYDWSKTLNTSKPEYYRWTQWLFLQMFNNDLAYRKNADVNWCNSCQTVLAHEQAQDGTCERCGTAVVQKPMTQWYWKLSNYADRLLEGLDKLDWPPMTKYMQHEWIGKSEGAEILFSIKGSEQEITVFTTRPDTIYGATFMVLAPEHPLVQSLTTEEQKSEVGEFLKRVINKPELQRKIDQYDGAFTGSYAVNPITNEEIPIYIAEYVLMNYGKGAIMAVPNHDERDLNFAHSYELDVKLVVKPNRSISNFSYYVEPGFAVATKKGGDLEAAMKTRDDQDYNAVIEGAKCWTGPGECVNSGFLDNLETEEAKEKVYEWLKKNNKGKRVVNYRIRDWSVSRQRYWGAPIPIVYDPDGKPHAIPEEHLPWELPRDVEFKPTGTAPLAQSKELKERTEKIFGEGWTPEVDTMDTFVCSSFYQFRYLAEGSSAEFVPKDIEAKWMPADMYIGGPEHACMHLIYARFVTMALNDWGHVSTDEPFKRLVHQGLITHGGAKMSKSKGNVVSPDAFIEQYGSDVFRMYLMFMGPFTEGGDWSDTGINGTERFVQRVWRLFGAESGKRKAESEEAKDVVSKLHQTIKKVTGEIEKLQFNTAIAALMELLNLLEKQAGVSKETAQVFVKLLSPMAPHLAEELWESLGGDGFVINQTWPTYDEALCKEDTLTIAVQINGKVRGEISVDADMAKEEIIKLAKQEPNVVKYLEGADIKKEIYVPGKLVSLVL